jgi:hypothetical protein
VSPAAAAAVASGHRAASSLASSLRRQERRREGGGVSRFHPNPTGLKVFCWAFPGQNQSTEQSTSVLSCRNRARILHPETGPNSSKNTSTERDLRDLCTCHQKRV